MAKNNYKIQQDKASEQHKGAYTLFNLDQRVKISLGLFLQGVAIFLALAFVSHFIHGIEDQCIIESIQELGLTKNPLVANWLGVIGAFIGYYFVHRWWGITAFFFLPFLFLVGLKWVMPKRCSKLSLFKFMLASIFLILWSNLLIGYLNLLYPNKSILTQQLGGIAYELSLIFNHLLGYGTMLLLVITLISFFVIYFNITSLPSFSFLKLFAKKKPVLANEPGEAAHDITNASEWDKKKKNNPAYGTPTLEEELAIEVPASNDKAIDFEVVDTQPKEQPKPLPPLSLTPKATLPKPSLAAIRSENYDPTLDLSNYQYPRLDLLEPYAQDSSAVTQEELEMNKNNIIETLNNFKINIVKIKATIGPTVTLYEIVPEAGVKISKIKNLEDDIALNLAALGIRIIAPIPGKGTIGIEVPNKNREIVPLQQVLACEKFLKGTMDLPVVLGKSISNEMVIADLARMPHLLIAGATGQGKSVGLNVILTSLIYKKHPSQLKLVLVDPKKVELSLYNKLERHFLAKLPATEEAIITETKKVIH